MIDLRRLRAEQAYQTGIESKGVSSDVINRVLELDEAHRSALGAVEEMRSEANAAAKAVGKLKDKDERDAKIAENSVFKAKLGEAEAALATQQQELTELALTMPNPCHESVPLGGEEDFRVENTVGEQSSAPAYDHGAVGELLGVVDTKRAVRMSGSRFAYVMGDAVRLQMALVQWTLAKVAEHGFTPVITPVLVREEMMELAGFFPTDRNQVYEVAEDELYLIGTSEIALAGLHREERIDATDLPVRYAGYSSCFRREAGTYGKDTSGLFRVHQFDKVEMFVYADPEKSWEELELLRQIEEEIVGGLELPYRVITVASGDLGAAAAKKYDLEVWLPSEQRYREVTSCSNYTDFSARRMNTKTKTDGGNVLTHTLNGTACAIGRTLLYIFENHQNPDGSVRIPTVLQPFCPGLEVIEPR